MAEPQTSTPPTVLTRLAVGGFKSHYEWTEIELRPLTLLAGANSSGKSSVMQALLLLKQTADMLPMDAGALKLDGPNVYFSEVGQFLSHRPEGEATGFGIRLGLSTGEGLELAFVREGLGIDIVACTYESEGQAVTVRRGEELAEFSLHPSLAVSRSLFMPSKPTGPNTEIKSTETARSGFFLAPGFRVFGAQQTFWVMLPDSAVSLNGLLQEMIHLSGLRGNPVRAYPRVALGGKQPGLFHERATSIIASWVDHRDPRLDQLNEALLRLGLTRKVEARARDATTVEVKISRTLKGSTADDLVSVADVGFGLSQSLPVVVALVAAEPNQLVYIEQPEIHLHPRAQKALADLIADTARRGARLVIETHSDIILSRLQWNIARKENPLPPEQVIAHWFERDPETGASRVRSNTPDETGAFGDWPVDFADVAAEVDREYAEAAFERLPPAEQ